MKAFTDIEQSKKMAEILPVESADMYYTICADEEDNAHDGYDDVRLRIENPFGDDELKKWYSCYEEIDWYDSPYIPCWSLAALLNYLREIDFFPEIDADKSVVTMNINYYDKEDESLLVPIHNIKVKAESFIDACYEMIIKLHE